MFFLSGPGHEHFRDAPRPDHPPHDGHSPASRERSSSLQGMDMASLPPRKRPWHDGSGTSEHREMEAQGGPSEDRGSKGKRAAVPSQSCRSLSPRRPPPCFCVSVVCLPQLGSCRLSGRPLFGVGPCSGFLLCSFEPWQLYPPAVAIWSPQGYPLGEGRAIFSQVLYLAFQPGPRRNISGTLTSSSQ